MATQEELAQGRRKPRGPKKHEERKGSRRALRGSQTPATWESVTPDALHSVILRISEAGGLVSFGKTRDGGALHFNVYHNGEKYQEYFRPSDDVDTILYEIAADFAPRQEHQQKLGL